MGKKLILVVAAIGLLSGCFGDRLEQRYAPDLPLEASLRSGQDVCIYPPPKDGEQQDTLLIAGGAEDKLLEIGGQALAQGICVTPHDYRFQADRPYSMRLNFVPAEARWQLQERYGRTFIARFKIVEQHGQRRIENLPAIDGKP
ncbi:hypothetical protein FS595_02550 [Serratia rubidaea]|uniref:putative T6SS immunity periplasmic lipoprotein n=1 Tax=Serratia rubidaea TaxID=61652 RepID=UPI001F1D7DE9|nr:putative T6SS immunity periplasmic lipoprotein [Serratia rubidaea]UJD78647.1 hypothetical protein FS596_02550 [Serratia rubidaea]UJD83198.1 hypothetical protein FS595_02550 [Serratia rubidaea]